MLWTRNKKIRPPQQTDSLFGAGGTLEGRVVCDSNLRIDGLFTGDIRCAGAVTVGAGGTVRAAVSAAELVIAGQVHGDVDVQGRLVILPTGSLHGNAAAGGLAIAEGGRLNGAVAMAPAPEPPADPAGAEPEAPAEAAPPHGSAQRPQRSGSPREAG